MVQGPESHAGARQEYERELAEFAERCREFAQNEGVPAALSHSESGARQWISDELTRRAQRLAVAARAENSAWLGLVGRQAMRGSWMLAGLVLVIDLATLPVSGSWTLPHTAVLFAFAALAVLVTGLSLVHSEVGGLLCFMVGADGRLSPAKALGLLWGAALSTALVYFAVEDFAAGTSAERSDISAAISHPRWEYVVLLAVPILVSAVTNTVAAMRMRRRAVPYLPGQRSQLRDLVLDETGFGSLASAVWLPTYLAAILFLIAGLAKNPYGLPAIPAIVVWISLAAAVLYAVVRLVEARQPVLVSVVRVRPPGGLDGPIRQGDDIEIRGLGFVPPAASAPDQLARIVVKLGPIHIHVPLVPGTEGGFSNPTDGSVTVPIPFDVDPGPWTVRVVTASGLETDDYALDIAGAED
ncbi:MAG TPA: hypothetical protein VFN97_14325 [Actinospica sp.]|nr:hypothetical protein [Actinospica sp.]